MYFFLIVLFTNEESIEQEVHADTITKFLMNMENCYVNKKSNPLHTLLEKIFTWRNFRGWREFIFADATVPQILRELIFMDTDIGKKRK